MTALLNSRCLSGCVPSVLVGIGAPLLAWRPKENVSEHLALAFEVALAREVLLVGFLWDSFSIFVSASSSSILCDSVRNI